MITINQLNYSVTIYESYLKKSGLRFGQHFCNTFGIHDPDVSYEKDTEIAIAKIKSKHVEL